MAEVKKVRIKSLSNTVGVRHRVHGEYRAGPGVNLLVPEWYARAIGAEFTADDGETVNEGAGSGVSAPAPSGKDGTPVQTTGDGAPRSSAAGTVTEPVEERRKVLFQQYDEMGDREDLVKMAEAEKVEVKGTGKDGYIKKDDVIAALVARDLAKEAAPAASTQQQQTGANG